MLCDNVVCAEAQYDVRGWEERRPAESQTQKREERITEVHIYCANSNKPDKQQNEHTTHENKEDWSTELNCCSTQLTRIMTGAQT